MDTTDHGHAINTTRSLLLYNIIITTSSPVVHHWMTGDITGGPMTLAYNN